MIVIGTKKELDKFKTLQNTIKRNCIFNECGCGKCIYNGESCFQGVLGSATIIDDSTVEEIIFKEKNNEKR